MARGLILIIPYLNPKLIIYKYINVSSSANIGKHRHVINAG